MQIKLNNSYILTSKDSIEAEHLDKINSTQVYANSLLLFVFLIILLLSVYRIKDPGFLISDEEFKLVRYAQSYSDRIQETMWNLMIFIAFLGSTFPRYDIFTRWRESKKYKQNFVCRETKSIFITEDVLTIESANFRESRKWDDFDKVLENKQVFLLLHSRKLESIVVPKRIFNNETELNTFRKLSGITKSHFIYSRK